MNNEDFNYIPRSAARLRNREIYNVYSDTEPSSEEMEGKFFWNKEY